MELTEVKSTQMHSVGYNDETQTLIVKFKSGQQPIFKYTPVHPSQFEALMASESKGKYFHEHIRNSKGIKYSRVDSSLV